MRPQKPPQVVPFRPTRLSRCFREIYRNPVSYVTLAAMPTYLRFVVADIDEDSGKELGVFHAVRGLREEGKLYQHEEELHDLARQWFNENLEKPTRFTASKPPFYRKPNKAISWFKDTAQVPHLKEEFGNGLVCDIDSNDIAEYQRKRLADGVSNRTVTDSLDCGDR